jgi:hypothetical protein
MTGIMLDTKTGGYTPGDTWNSVGKDHRVEYLVYHRGGPGGPEPLLAIS